VIRTLPDDLERLLAIQERFERIRRNALRTHGAALCDLSYANPYDGPPAVVLAAIARAIEDGRTLDLQYTPYGGSTITRRLVAGHASAQYGCTFHWRDIVLTPGAMSALKLLFRAVATEGVDEVVIVTPCWIDYPLYLMDLGMRPVFAPVGPDLHLDLDRLAAVLGPYTRAVVLSQPANPTGVIYTRAELSALADLLRQQPSPPLLISDECHREIRPPGTRLTSPIEFYEETCVVYSFGKHLLMQGQRIGYVAVSPRLANGRAWGDLLERLCRAMGFCTPTALMQLAIRHLLDVTLDLTMIDARRTRVTGALQQAGYDIVPPDATFFLYPRSPDPDDFAFAEQVAAAGVLLLPSSLFHHRGHVRLSLTASDEMIDRAIDVLGTLGATTQV
jgi:aspartate aminotransferase